MLSPVLAVDDLHSAAIWMTNDISDFESRTTYGFFCELLYPRRYHVLSSVNQREARYATAASLCSCFGSKEP